MTEPGPGPQLDLEACAREPIHIPGRVQPRGCLLVLREPDLVVTQASANLADVIGVEPQAALGARLAEVIGGAPADAVARAAASFGDLRERNPLELTISIGGRSAPIDGILHREGSQGVLLLEFEPSIGPRPFSFPNTYLAVRGAVAALNRASSMQQLFDVTARAVRELTGFDRVMVYRYDADHNGEVVAEDRRDDLNPFLGLHYPASDIPAQARALYEKNWIRLIDDVDYVAAPLLPEIDPVVGSPVDLTYSTLRSVSPVHLEYLRNMGVRASMSISLLHGGRLWGLIACHQYSGPYAPPYGVRAAAEFLGSTLSLRLVDQSAEDDLRARVASRDTLTKLTAATFAESRPLVEALLGEPGLFDLIRADGVALYIEGREQRAGLAPESDELDHIVTWLRSTGDEVVVTDSLARDAPHLGVDPARCAGVLAITLRDGQYVLWTRAEQQQRVDWGGDPHNKAIAVHEGAATRLGPRRSFQRWSEVVRGRSSPWSVAERADAATLRGHILETLYTRAQREIGLAEILQRSLLPPLPELDGWSVSAHYEPAAGSKIGGDWYDAFEVRGNRLVVVLGDVAGHGVGAAGTMSQLRNVLRAYLLDSTERATGVADDRGPGDVVALAGAVTRLNDYMCQMAPGAFATLVVGTVDLGTGAADLVLAGHPRPFVVGADGRPGQLVLAASPPVGVPRASFRGSTLNLLPGQRLVVFSDGLIERRNEDLDHGLRRLAAALSDDAVRTAQEIFAAMVGTGADDDATVMSLHRRR